MASIDSGSDSVTLNGLNDGTFNDITCDNIEVDQNAIIAGSLTVGGPQIYTGPAIYSNSVTYNGPVYGLTGLTGILYDPINRTITNIAGDYWSATGSNDIVNQSGKIVNITREGATSKLVLNYSATGATRVGIFYNDNNDSVIDYPLITTGTTSDELLLGTPNNQSFGGYLSMKPKVLSAPELGRNYVILQKPFGSSQTVESDLNIQGSLKVNSNDYKSYFSSSGFPGLTYNGTGNYDLDVSSIEQSKWSTISNTIYPKLAKQILVGPTGVVADANSSIQIKSSTIPQLLIEGTQIGVNASLKFKNQASLEASIQQESNIDLLTIRPSSGLGLSVIPDRVGINNQNPTYQLEVKNESINPATVITSYNDNSGGYAGLFLRNNSGLPLVIFGNGSTRLSEGGPGVANIRNDTGEKIRLQNNYEFGFGPQEVILGDPQAIPTIQGNASNSLMHFRATIFKDDYIYFGGYINSTVSTIIKNFNGSNSSFTIPSTGSIRIAMVLQYTITGDVNNVWTMPSGVISEIKTLTAGSDRIYACGSYSSTINLTLNNLNGTLSTFTLPQTNAIAGYYAGWAVGFSTGPIFKLDRLNTIYGGNTSSEQNFTSSIQEDSSGNVFIGGTIISNNNAVINNFKNIASGFNLNLTNAQNGFIFRFDLNGNYTGHWGWNLSTYACYVNSMAIVPSGNRLYVAMTVYNTGVAITIPNWNGAGASTYQILGSSGYSSAHWTALLVKFTGVSSIASPTVIGRQAFGNDNLTSYIPFPLSTVCYSSFHDKVYWSSPVTNTAQIAFFNSMTDASYSQVLSPPQGNVNTGIMTFIQYNDATSSIYGYPGSIWGYNTVFSGVDGIYQMRENPFNGNVYLQGSIYTDNQPVFRGFFETNSRVQFPSSFSFGSSRYLAFSIVVALNNVLGLSSVPYSSNWSYCSDICFPSSSRLITSWTMANNTGQVIRNYNQYNSNFSIPSLSLFPSGVIIDYTTRKTVSTYFTSSGVGIGRTNQGIAEIEIEKGIMTPSFIQCSEIRVNDYSLPLKFTDSIGREIGSLCRAWVSLDGVRAFQPIIKASMNVRYIDKTANGKYRIFFSQYAPHDRFATFVSSTSYNSGNYSVFPFIDTNATPGFPAYKFVYGIGVSVNNTSGTGFDLQEVNVACFW